MFFQIINLPVEFNASSRAKTELVGLGIISHQELPYVSKVLTAAALTYVAATLQTVAQVAYHVFQFLLMTQSNRD
jgi:Zn-dependent membrane protease YugP